MLVINRRSVQSFRVIEADITVHIEGSQVKVSIDAPRHILVVRDDAKPQPKETENWSSWFTGSQKKLGAGSVQPFNIRNAFK